MGKTKMECKKLDSLTGSQKCVFCQRMDIDEMKYGPIYMHRNIVTHYYCLLLSSNMEQNGRDCDGILGFLPNDIQKEVKRGVRLHCSFCRSGGATLGCAIAKCKVVFHLPCGMNHGTLHQFFGEFKSFCAKHRPVQRISEKILAESSKNAMCGICYEKVIPRPIHETLWAPCCQKNAFFHRECVQKLATSAGYFFKCPLCNNTTTFQKEMKEFGIYIPEQDASWECVPNAYQDLLVRHDSCDSATCGCPSGRKTNNQGTRWELILCKYCGSQGIHIGCGRLKWRSPEWVCDICAGNNGGDSQEGNTRNYQGNRHRLSGTGRAAEIHPSVSADREREASEDESSEDSFKVTVTNRGGRRRVLSPPSMSSSPPPNHKKPVPTSTIVVDEPPEIDSRAIVIDDSDDDVEVVSETKGSCLKTKDGATIPVVKMRDSVKKRLNVEGDVNILPEEIVDITIQMHGPPRKKAPSPFVEEVVYSLPVPKPNTSYSSPSTSFAPPPDMTKFVLVDPSTFRPEDLPPGTVLYRSVQPMVTVPQTTIPPQPQMPTGQVPMPQLGRASRSRADAQHPDFSQHWCRGSDHFHTTACSVKETSRKIKCDSGGRRGRGRHHSDRLNPTVLVSPLKYRISGHGYIEILLSRRNFCFGLGLNKRKATSLPFRPAKKIKPSSKPSGQRRKVSSNNVNRTEIKNTTQRKTPSMKKLESSMRSVEMKTRKHSKSSQEGNIVQKGPRETHFTDSNSQAVMCSHAKLYKDNKKSANKEKVNNIVGKENSSLKEKKIAERNKKMTCTIMEWNFKTIDEYMNKLGNKSKVQLNENHMETELSNVDDGKYLTTKFILDELIENAIQKCEAEERLSGSSETRAPSSMNMSWETISSEENKSSASYAVNAKCDLSALQVGNDSSSLDEEVGIGLATTIEPLISDGSCREVTRDNCTHHKMQGCTNPGKITPRPQSESCMHDDGKYLPFEKVESLNKLQIGNVLQTTMNLTKKKCAMKINGLFPKIKVKASKMKAYTISEKKMSKKPRSRFNENDMNYSTREKNGKVQKTKNRKLEQVSFVRKMSTIEKYFSPIKKDNSCCEPTRKFENTTYCDSSCERETETGIKERYLSPVKKENLFDPLNQSEKTYYDRSSEKEATTGSFPLFCAELEYSKNGKKLISEKSPEKVNNTAFPTVTPESVNVRLLDSSIKRPLMEVQLNKANVH